MTRRCGRVFRPHPDDRKPRIPVRDAVRHTRPARLPAAVRTTIATGINDRAMRVATRNLDQSGAPRTPITKGYLERRGQITSEAYELVSFPNAPKTFANGITNAGTVVGNNIRRGAVTSARAFICQHGVYSIIDLHALCAESPRPGANERDDVVGFCSDTGG